LKYRIHYLGNDERGVSLLELALSLPILLLIIAGVVDFGLALRSTLNISDATRFGARQAVLSIYQGQRSSIKRPRVEYCEGLKSLAALSTQQKLGNDPQFAPEVSLEPEITDTATLQDAYLRNAARKLPRRTQLIKVKIRDQSRCVFCFGEVLTRTMVGNESVFALDEPCLQSEFEVTS